MTSRSADNGALSRPALECLFLIRVENLGGAELSMLTLAMGLRQKGHAVAFAVYGSHPELLAEKADGMEILNLQAPRTRSAILPLYKLLRERRPRILITALEYTNLIGIAVARLVHSDIRVIVTCHNPFFVALRTHYPFESRLLKNVIGLVYPFGDAVVTVSQGVGREVNEMLIRPVPVQVIYNPVIGDDTKGSPETPHPWLADRSCPVLIAIGRLNPVKDFATLLRAFAVASAQTPLRLVLLGEGEERESLEVLAASLNITERVLFAGFVDNVNDWLRHGAVLVSSSRLEGFGNVIVEAMNHGVPVVATDCPVGPAEILENGRLGSLVPVGDVQAMANAILSQLATAPDKAALKARAGDFTVKRCVEAYAALIEEVQAS